MANSIEIKFGFGRERMVMGNNKEFLLKNVMYIYPRKEFTCAKKEIELIFVYYTSEEFEYEEHTLKLIKNAFAAKPQNRPEADPCASVIRSDHPPEIKYIITLKPETSITYLCD